MVEHHCYEVVGGRMNTWSKQTCGVAKMSFEILKDDLW